MAASAAFGLLPEALPNADGADAAQAPRAEQSMLLSRLNRVPFTPQRVADLVAFVMDGTRPAGRTRAQLRKLLALAARYSWRVVGKPANRFQPVLLAVASSAAAAEARAPNAVSDGDGDGDSQAHGEGMLDSDGGAPATDADAESSTAFQRVRGTAAAHPQDNVALEARQGRSGADHDSGAHDGDGDERDADAFADDEDDAPDADGDAEGEEAAEGDEAGEPVVHADAASTAVLVDAATERVLEVLAPIFGGDHVPDTARPLVWHEVVPTDRVDAALAALWRDPAVGGLRGGRTLYKRALGRGYVGIAEAACLRFCARQETLAAVQPPVSLVLHPIVPTSLGHWQIDLTNVALPTATDSKWVVVAVDLFSKYAWAAPLPNKRSPPIVSWLEEVWLREGAPRILQSDGGGEFTGAAMNLLALRYDVQRRVCRPYNSACDGAVERLNRSVKDALLKATTEYATRERDVDWVHLLPYCLHSYNTSIHSTTGFSPFAVQRGRAARELGPLLVAPAPPLPAASAAAADVGTDAAQPCGTLPRRVAGAAAAAAAGRLTTGAASAAAGAGGASTAGAGAGAGARAAATSGKPKAKPAQQTDTFDIARVLATRVNVACGGRREYLARWAGFGAEADSWVSPSFWGSSDAEFDAWIADTHGDQPPLALAEPYEPPSDYNCGDEENAALAGTELPA